MQQSPLSPLPTDTHFERLRTSAPLLQRVYLPLLDFLEENGQMGLAVILALHSEFLSRTLWAIFAFHTSSTRHCSYQRRLVRISSRIRPRKSFLVDRTSTSPPLRLTCSPAWDFGLLRPYTSLNPLPPIAPPLSWLPSCDCNRSGLAIIVCALVLCRRRPGKHALPFLHIPPCAGRRIFTCLHCDMLDWRVGLEDIQVLWSMVATSLARHRFWGTLRDARILQKRR